MISLWISFIFIMIDKTLNFKVESFVVIHNINDSLLKMSKSWFVWDQNWLRSNKTLVDVQFVSFWHLIFRFIRVPTVGWMTKDDDLKVFWFYFNFCSNSRASNSVSRDRNVFWKFLTKELLCFFVNQLHILVMKKVDSVVKWIKQVLSTCSFWNFEKSFWIHRKVFSLVFLTLNLLLLFRANILFPSIRDDKKLIFNRQIFTISLLWNFNFP